MKRAVILVLQDKAEIVESGDGSIRSKDSSIPRPSVIRLKYYVNVPYSARVALNRRSVLTRDNHECQFTHCNRRATTIDHVVPRSKGGKHEWTNVVGACSRCNAKKADKSLEAMGWKLKRPPVTPKGNLWLVAGLRARPEWESYLNDM